MTSTTRVDSATAGLVQAALAESAVLNPFIKDKVPKARISDGFKIYDSDAEFEFAYVKSKGITNKPDSKALQAELATVRGFFNTTTKTIHLRPTSNLGHALHEAIHKLASPGFQNFYGEFLNEGVTAYFTDCVLVEQGLDKAKHTYGPNLACAHKLVANTGVALVARAFFDSHVELSNALVKRLRIDWSALSLLIRDKKICDLLPH